MSLIKVSIVRFVDEHQPGVVECEFPDANGIVRTVIDKTPMFTNEFLWWDSTYPVQGVLSCSVLKTWQDPSGRNLALISIAKPYYMEATDGQTEFTVVKSQLSET